MSNYLQDLVRRAYPGADVRQRPDGDHEVRFAVSARSLIADRNVAWRRILERMRPQTPPRTTRRIHWGRRNGVAMMGNPRLRQAR